MNEASVWRQALAQKIAIPYTANPKVSAVAVIGSAAQGDADRFSDIDLAVFWTEPPTDKERKNIARRASGKRGPLGPSHMEDGRWSEEFEVGGVAIDVQHMTVEISERILADVLEGVDLSLAKQQHLATLLSAFPLSESSVLTRWQQQALIYPHELGVAMVREHLIFPQHWEQEMLAERNELFLLYECLCLVEKHILLVLLGLNRLYYPGFRRLDRLVEQMSIAPLHLVSRFKQVFDIASIDARASVYQLHDLVEETFRLVKTHLSEVDTTQARERFAQRRQIWEHAPDKLV
jgi:Polymerase beta, Nucleotidyltransferase